MNCYLITIQFTTLYDNKKFVNHMFIHAKNKDEVKEKLFSPESGWTKFKDCSSYNVWIDQIEAVI